MNFSYVNVRYFGAMIMELEEVKMSFERLYLLETLLLDVDTSRQLKILLEETIPKFERFFALL